MVISMGAHALSEIKNTPPAGQQKIPLIGRDHQSVLTKCP